MKTSRREFLGKALAYVPALAASCLAFPFYDFISYSSQRKKKVVIPIDNITSNVTFIREIPAFIVKTPHGFEVLDAHCTHMGCIVNFSRKDRLFECPCHGSEFTVSGKRIKGPAKKPLKRLAFKINDGKIIIG